MKRLLAYLFIVLGLEIVVGVNARADLRVFLAKYFCINKPGETYYFGFAFTKKKCNGYALRLKYNKELVEDIRWMANKPLSELRRRGHPNKFNTFKIITKRINKNELYEWKNYLQTYHGINFDTQTMQSDNIIATELIDTNDKESRETQAATKRTEYINQEYIKWKKQAGKDRGHYKVIHTDTNKIFEGYARGKSSSSYLISKEQAFLRCENSDEGKRNPNGCVAYDENQSAKKEPIQTQKTTKDKDVVKALNKLIEDYKSGKINKEEFTSKKSEILK